MKIRTKILALVMAIVMLVPLSFSSCKDAETVEGAYVQGSGFTKEYFEANKMEVIEKSIDVKEMFGFDDSFFDFFKNEKLKNGMQGDIEIVEDGVAMNMSVATLAEPFKARVDVNVVTPENPELPIEASVYADSKKLSLSSGLFLGEAPIELKFERLDVMIEKLAGSALGKMLQVPGSDEINAQLEEMGINGEYISKVKKAFEDYKAKYGDGSVFAESLINKMSGIVEGTLGEVGEAAVNNYEGAEVQAYTLTSTIDKDDIINIINAVLDMYAEVMNSSTDLTKTLMSFDEELTATYDETEMTSVIDEMKAEILSAFELVDISGVETLYFDKANGKYFKSDVEMTVIVDGESVNITGNKYVVDNGVLFDLTAKHATEPGIIKANGGITAESNADKYAISLDMNVVAENMEDDEELEPIVMKAGFDVDKKNETYNLYADMTTEGEQVKMYVKGTVKSSAEEFVLSVEEVSVDEEVLEIPENKIVFRAIDDIAGHENAKNIFELDENEVYGILARFSALTGAVE